MTDYFKQLIESPLVGAYVADRTGRFVFANKRIADMFGYGVDEVHELTMLEPIAPELRPWIVERMKERRADEHEPDMVRAEMVRKDGSRFPALILPAALRDDRGEMSGFLGIVIDISHLDRVEVDLRLDKAHLEHLVEERTTELSALNTRLANEVEERRTAQERAEASERRFRLLVENVNEVIFSLDVEGRITYLSPSAERFGLAIPDDYEGHSFAEVVHEDDLERAAASFVAILKGEKRPNEYRLKSPDGSVLHARISSRAVLEGDRAVGVAGTATNITEQKTAEAALRSSELRYRNLLEHAPAGICEIDLATMKTLSVNDVICSILGCSREEVLEKGVMHYTDDEGRQRASDRIKKVLAGQPVPEEAEYRMIKPDGEERCVVVHTRTIFDGDQPVRSHAVVHDVTERRKLDEELAKAQRLESIGILAGGIAHDFNNILAGIQGHIALAALRFEERDASTRDAVLDHLQEAEKACDRAALLTQQLLTFSSGGAPIKQPSSLDEIIADSCTFAVHGSKTKCDFRLPEDLWPVEVDAGQISQVFNNLALNAAQAMTSGGVLVIEARNVDVAADSQLPLKPGRFVMVSLTDEGEGIDEALLPSIFDPFVSTKARGTGLGLATAFSIIKKHAGHLGVVSTLGAGSTFTLYLPASDKQPIQVDEETFDEHGTGSILFMDDDVVLREVAFEMLTSFGYEVTTARDGVEAVELYRRAQVDGARFDGVVVDLTVAGGMGGIETMARLLKIDPDVRALVSSGYSTDPVMSDYRAHGFKGIVTKPYSRAQLGRALKELLEGD